MKYKLFISDYDGTLGEAPENKIDNETLDAINKFTQKGGIFVVCSGRETTSITRILREHNLKGLVVSFQGARINDIESGKSIVDGGLDKEHTLLALDAVEEYRLTPLLYGKNDFFYQEKNDYIRFYEKAIRLEGRVANVREEVMNGNSGSVKICWLGEDEIVNRAADALNAKFKGVGIKFNSGAKNLLEAINPQYCKGDAVKFLSKYYNVPLNEIIAVGDSTNDIDLIKGEWHGVAVGDGREELKAVAKEITVPFEQKPVKTLLEKYCL